MDYYKVLEVHCEASSVVIKKAYQTLAMRYHPDKNPVTRKRWAEEKFKELSEAYHVLADPMKRRDYDRTCRYASVRPSYKRAGHAPDHRREDDAAVNAASKVSREKKRKKDELSRRKDEEAYFLYRKGLDCFYEAQKSSLFRILCGKRNDDLAAARDLFVRVLNEYPGSKVEEDSLYYYVCVRMACFNYADDFIDETAHAVDTFLKKYQQSKHLVKMKLLSAKFFLHKKREYTNAYIILQNLCACHAQSSYVREAKRLLAYIDGLRENGNGLKV